MKHANTRIDRALLIVLMLAGCDRGESADIIETEIDACTLLEAAELQEILGADAGEGVPGVPADALTDGAPAVDCRWASPDNTRTLTLVLRRAMSADDARAAIDPVRESFMSGGFTPARVEGLGDDAFFAFNQLHVRQGADYLTVSITGFSNEEALRAARAAATQSLERLATATGT